MDGLLVIPKCRARTLDLRATRSSRDAFSRLLVCKVPPDLRAPVRHLIIIEWQSFIQTFIQDFPLSVDRAIPVVRPDLPAPAAKIFAPCAATPYVVVRRSSGSCCHVLPRSVERKIPVL